MTRARRTFTALVTPYEVAFLEQADLRFEPPDTMFFVNRFVDVFFIVDIVLICNTMYELPLTFSGAWIGRRRMILQHYFCSPWSYIDILSIFPFYAIEWVVDSNPVLAEDAPASPLKAIRLLKLFRLMRFSRCLKASGHLKPYLEDLVLGRMECTYAGIQVFQLIASLLLYTHIQACVWGLVSSFMDPPTWISTYEAGHHDAFGALPAPWEVYLAAIYWSAMTVTSIGYGQMLPVNPLERLVCSVLMVLSGIVWTYILSTAAGIAATLNPNKVLFQTTMDQLNYFMRERKLKVELRQQLRQFFEKAKQVREVNDDSHLLMAMSPQLRGMVAYAANRHWVNQIWYLRMMGGTRESREFLAFISDRLRLCAYVAEERPALGKLYILRRGMTVKNWRFYRAGGVWGDDVILDLKTLMDHAQAVAITYAEAFTLSREALVDAAKEYPQANILFARSAARVRMQRALIMHACELKGTRPRSFVPQVYASGFYFAPRDMSLEAKVDALTSITSGGGRSSDAMADDLGADLPLATSFKIQPRACASSFRYPGAARASKNSSSVLTAANASGAAACNTGAGAGARPASEASGDLSAKLSQLIAAVGEISPALEALTARVEAVESNQAAGQAAVAAQLAAVSGLVEAHAPRRRREASKSHRHRVDSNLPPAAVLASPVNGGGGGRGLAPAATGAVDYPATTTSSVTPSNPAPRRVRMSDEVTASMEDDEPAPRSVGKQKSHPRRNFDGHPSYDA